MAFLRELNLDLRGGQWLQSYAIFWFHSLLLYYFFLKFPEPSVIFRKLTQTSVSLCYWLTDPHPAIFWRANVSRFTIWISHTGFSCLLAPDGKASTRHCNRKHKNMPTFSLVSPFYLRGHILVGTQPRRRVGLPKACIVTSPMWFKQWLHFACYLGIQKEP